MLAIQSDYQAISGRSIVFNFKSFLEICQFKLSWLTALYIKKIHMNLNSLTCYIRYKSNVHRENGCWGERRRWNELTLKKLMNVSIYRVEEEGTWCTSGLWLIYRFMYTENKNKTTKKTSGVENKLERQAGWIGKCRQRVRRDLETFTLTIYCCCSRGHIAND